MERKRETVQKKLTKLEEDKDRLLGSKSKEAKEGLNYKETLKYLIFSLEDLVEVILNLNDNIILVN